MEKTRDDLQNFRGMKLSQAFGMADANWQESNMAILTTENAPNALSVRNREHPEWGTFRFNYNAQPLSGGGSCSVIGSGSNSRILPWHEYDRWEVASFRQPSPFSIAMEAFAQAGWDFAKENQ